ncbi:MAG: cytochrome c biogenesis protein CcdA [Bradyrhizobium sp.]
MAGLVVGVAPSSFPLISVATGLALGRGAVPAEQRHVCGLELSVGFALGVATVDATLGALFGFFGFAVLRFLASYLAFAYLLFAIVMLVTALALLRVIHIVVPTLAPVSKPARGFGGSYLLGLPFGLSTCPACTPLLLPVVAAAASTADPLMGAVLMGAFGIARGIPIVVAATMAGSLAHLGSMRRFTLWAERLGAALMIAAALFFLYQAALYAGWLRP